LKYFVLFAVSLLLQIGLIRSESSAFVLHKEKSKENSTGGNKMPIIRFFLYELNESDLAKIEISYLHHSGKLGAGYQEIIFLGDGTVQLKKTVSLQAKPEIVEGRVDKKVFLPILALMEEENFLGLEDDKPTNGRNLGYRKLTLKLPLVTKSVLLCEPGNPQFERIGGALKVIAGIALPQALGYKFFPNF
jgi:hypothetical protein